MKDIAVFESVERELNRQRNNIELIASPTRKPSLPACKR